ncbi:hypothetical protein I302_108305 [Kwoniella bestiolae CBS 10118]|uniref:LysM domain-containing protein n=1 Tax=Kwoniella bestiolae CBS 10118 TaxID=1296100 RepID=A0A1B9FW23_9TREE|nr:hypothetical protein I302_07326 [Kwoniella bestiolae CBS 10118]OCF22976.1 hypothetical protein I302_07326 [Kwoniella bestiolae CBS 10118]
MQASTSSYTPPSDSEIWAQSQSSSSNYNLTSNGSPSSSPELGGRRTLRSRNGAQTPRMTHPLSALTPPTLYTDVLGDVSRPNLMRLTSETERQVAESSASGGSMRGSLDLLRMTPTEAGEDGREVEVLIHTIKPNESLAGIALLYGIDLATLRKSNKLWSSDPLHIRTHLYVPLEACRWNKARETLVRGPGEGQVTLLPKTIHDKGKGKAKEVNGYNLFSNEGENGILDLTDSPKPQTYLPNSSSTSSLSLASTFLPSTNHSYDQNHPSPPTSTEPLASPSDDGNTPRILDVVRIPSSQLRFFPKPKPDKPPDGARRSLDYFNSKSSRSPGSNALSSPLSRDGRPSGELERRSIEDTLHNSIPGIRRNSHTKPPSPDGPTIINDLSTLPPSLRPTSPHQSHSHSQSYSKGRSKSTIVKIRPPIPQTLHPHQRNASSGAMESIKGSIQNFFTVPPPPPAQSPFTYNTLGRSSSQRKERPRVASSPSTSTLALGRNSPNMSSPVVRKQESLELKTRYSELGLDLGLGGLGINVPSSHAVRKGLGRKDSLGGGDKGDKQD